MKKKDLTEKLLKKIVKIKINKLRKESEDNLKLLNVPFNKSVLIFF